MIIICILNYIIYKEYLDNIKDTLENFMNMNEVKKNIINKEKIRIL